MSWSTSRCATGHRHAALSAQTEPMRHCRGRRRTPQALHWSGRMSRTTATTLQTDIWTSVATGAGSSARTRHAPAAASHATATASHASATAAREGHGSVTMARASVTLLTGCRLAPACDAQPPLVAGLNRKRGKRG